MKQRSGEKTSSGLLWGSWLIFFVCVFYFDGMPNTYSRMMRYISPFSWILIREGHVNWQDLWILCTFLIMIWWDMIFSSFDLTGITIFTPFLPWNNRIYEFFLHDFYYELVGYMIFHNLPIWINREIWFFTL